MKSSFSEWLALTATERKVGLFLLVTFVLGLGIRLYNQTFPSSQQFDYRESDSTFSALSEAPMTEKQKGESLAPAGPLNINTATKSELIRLPGIGEVTAERIMLYRENTGRFSSVEELRNIRGISKLKLEKLKPLVTVH